MTQLTLFADLAPGVVLVPSPVVVPQAQKGDSTTSRLITSSESEATSSDSKGLMQLAELIRQGREQMQAQARRRSRPVQSIGDLAQAVLLRHDLVARRRARSNSRGTASSPLTGAGIASRQADLADTPSEVHVAS